MTDTPYTRVSVSIYQYNSVLQAITDTSSKIPFKLRNVLLSTVPYGLPWIPFAINFFVV